MAVYLRNDQKGFNTILLRADPGGEAVIIRQEINNKNVTFAVQEMDGTVFQVKRDDIVGWSDDYFHNDFYSRCVTLVKSRAPVEFQFEFAKKEKKSQIEESSNRHSNTQGSRSITFDYSLESLASHTGKERYEMTAICNPIQVDVSTQSNYTVFHLSLIAGNWNIIPLLYKQNPDLIYKQSESGDNPLHAAASSGKIDVLDWVYDIHPQIINSKAKDGSTPMHSAIEMEHFDAAKWLYQKQPNLLEESTNTRITPLHVAALKGNVQLIEWILLERPNLIFKKTSFGFDAASAAYQKGHHHAQEFLCEFIGLINDCKDITGFWPIDD